MIRFNTYDEASLFAAMKRADGYFAEVIHQNAGHIWGASAVNGFPVLVSEDVIPEDATAPEKSNERPSELAMMMGMLGLCGMALSIVFVLFLSFTLIVGIALTFAAIPVISKVIFIIFPIVMFYILWGMLKLTRVYNRPKHHMHRLARVVLGIVGWLMWVHTLLAWN